MANRANAYAPAGSDELLLTNLGLMQAGFDHMDEGISIYDSELRLVAWNKAFVELIEFPVDLLQVGRPIADLIGFNINRGTYGKGDPEKILSSYLALVEKGERRNFERVRPDGGVVEISWIPLPDGGLVITYRDVTESRRAAEERCRVEEDLRESERRMHTLADASPSLISYVGADRVYRFVNQTYANWYGKNTDEIVGISVQELHGQETYAHLKPNIDAVLSGQKVTLEATLEGVVLGARSIQGSLVPDFDQQENVVGYFVFTNDVTDLKTRERELHQANKMEALGLLAGGVAHEFTNLLLPIIALTTSSISELPENDKVAAKLKKVLQAAKHGRSILNQIMDFSRQRSPDRSTVALADVFGEAIALLKATLPPQIEVLFSADCFDEIAIVDPMEIHQIISNLGINAAKAINKQAGKIEFRLQRFEAGKTRQKAPKDLKPGRYAHLAVSDTGCGMDKDIPAKIFEPFFTTRPKGAGMGMGLTIVHAIVTRHEGSISVESRPGEGTTFDIYLPLEEPSIHDEKSSNDGIAYDDQQPATAEPAVGE